MGTSSPPVAVARWVVGQATRVLPPADRERYRREFVAELHGLSPAEQARYVAGLLSQVLALRAALGSSSGSREIPMGTTTRAPFRCRVLRMHRWTARGAPHHTHVRTCLRCGYEQGPFNTPDESPTRNYLTGI
ncbi:hypothetical protein [Petropleomorpha daqingensis]|uniref:Uncharacterized protein n=1 Tax=Petropleomorpha daqingensis TaxID=2026353 RepID=A0A853CHX1_9ACTN|nr:hypothetical protein [Petropleomorpha daqingensis]NYJ06569.1 hypothetical protein [Petropleomorpha daqingensis]